MAPSDDAATAAVAPPQYWVDLSSLPNSAHTDSIPSIRGSAPYATKLAVLNVFYAYGVGEPGSFGDNVGSRCAFTEIERDRNVIEVEVNAGMLNGAKMLHGGCMAYLIDNCASSPLVSYGLEKGLGVTLNMVVNFHAPIPPGTKLEIKNSVVSFGKRIMSGSSMVYNKETGKLVASGTVTKMEPIPRARL